VRPEADGQYEVDSPDDLDHDTVSHGSARSEEHRSSSYAQNPSSHGLRPHSPIVRSAPGFIGLVEATDTPGVNQTSRDVTTPTDGRIAFSHGVVGRGSVEEAEEVAFFLRQYSEGLAKGYVSLSQPPIPLTSGLEWISGLKITSSVSRS